SIRCPLIKRINRKAAEQLGIEIGGLLRQHFAGKRDATHLLDSRGIHEKGYVSALADPRYGLEGVALILNVLQVADRLFGNAQDPLDKNAVYLSHLQLPLSWRRPFQPLLDPLFFRAQQVRSLARTG